MNKIKSQFTPLFLSTLNLIFLTIGHYYSIRLLVLATLLCYCVIFMLADIQLVFPLLLFHLAWTPLLRLDVSYFSFFSLISFPILIRLAFRLKKDVNIITLLLAAFFIGFVFIVRYARMEPIQTSFLNFAVFLIMMTLLLVDRRNYSDFKVCVIYYTVGMLLSCFAAYLVFSSPNLQQFITFKTTRPMDVVIVRLSGLTGDPNYFSSQILVAIACLLVLFNNAKSFYKTVIYFTLIATLLYFGFSSVSKMFLFSVGLIFIIWFISIIISDIKLIYKIGWLSLLVVLITVALETQLFSGLASEYAMRLTEIADVQSLTTGRSDLLRVYIDFLLSNVGDLMFGQGFTSKIVALASNDIHNTFIQILYEAGIIGTFLLGSWFIAVYKISTSKSKMSLENKFLLVIFILSFILPWFALDMLFWNEFFCYLIFLIYLKNYLVSNNNEQAFEKKPL